MESDVPLGFLLSGGVDSSAIVALAREANGDGGAPDTYSVAFPPGEGPERQGDWIRSEDAPYIDAVVRHVGSEHREIVVPGSELLAHRDVGLDARDHPGWGEPDTSLFLLFRGVRDDVTVALSGEVADEVFGGYVFFHDDQTGPVEKFPWLNGGASSPTSLLRADVAAEVRPQDYARDRLQEALDEVPALPGESAGGRARPDALLPRVHALAPGGPGAQGPHEHGDRAWRRACRSPTTTSSSTCGTSRGR